MKICSVQLFRCSYVDLFYTIVCEYVWCVREVVYFDVFLSYFRYFIVRSFGHNETLKHTVGPRLMNGVSDIRGVTLNKRVHS